VKPRIGIFGLTSCAGDQLAIINCEEELLDILSAVDIRSFVMAQSRNEDQKLDVAFVEGSVVTQEDEEKLKKIREESGLVIAIGTCAVWGGIPASRNDLDRKELYQRVYQKEENLYQCRPQVSPLSEVVKVDFSIAGCPIEKEEILRSVASLVHGDLPLLPSYAVCFECKLKENVCLLKEKGQLCCGPITLGGCEARCPSLSIPCKGCRGPVPEANIASEFEILREKGYSPADIARMLTTFAYSTDILTRREGGKR
jgi:coenzyme F420-reducing hydrogenase gamma subunit